MFSELSQLAVRRLNRTRISFVIVIATLAIQLIALAGPQQEIPRSIISDDFTNARPKSKSKTHNPSRIYRLASRPRTKSAAESSFETLQLGLTIWKLEPASAYSGVDRSRQLERVAKRVEADAKFHEGDLLRLSIESPREGYLYIIDRDWFTDGSSGETNLIFPVRGEDNRLEPGKLIDIPADNKTPFRAKPKPNQAGELLTIIVTKSPLRLPLSNDPLPIRSTQLTDWERRWTSLNDRYELEDGAGQLRTIQEQEAATSRGLRQLTRDDPAPQTIYLLSNKNRDEFLFNVMLSYVH